MVGTLEEMKDDLATVTDYTKTESVRSAVSAAPTFFRYHLEKLTGSKDM